jgi:hypothetical protein
VVVVHARENVLAWQRKILGRKLAARCRRSQTDDDLLDPTRRIAVEHMSALIGRREPVVGAPWYAGAFSRLATNAPRSGSETFG